MRNYFTFGSINSTTYGVYISGSGVYNAPERLYDVVSVPGRNGDLIISNGKYANIDVTYPAFIFSNFKSNVADFRTALLSQNGYTKLSDTYHPDEYRIAFYTGGLEVDPHRNDAGEFEITFNCKPQRFLNSGDTATTFNSSGTITNPTLCASQPLIRVYGYGTVTIGSNVISVGNAYTYIDIDSEIMDCYSGNINANSLVSFSTGNFPTLVSGSNSISFSSNVSKVVITPRWWHL